MYIKPTRTYYVGSEQRAARGPFLLLLQPKEGDGPIKAAVRSVALAQCGHWMMGRARLYSRTVIVSGAYGSDGLPCTVERAVYDRLPVTLPENLLRAWNTGGGWNSAGNEAGALRTWARANERELRL